MATTMSKCLIMGIPLEKVIELSTVAPAKEIALFVKNDNVKAIGFYKRSGFAIAREVPVVMGHMHFTDYVMVRAL